METHAPTPGAGRLAPGRLLRCAVGMLRLGSARIAVVALILFVLVLIPTTFELMLHELVFRALHEVGLGVELLAEWILAAVLGGTIGVIEVALATELMARSPEPSRYGRGFRRDHRLEETR